MRQWLKIPVAQQFVCCFLSTLTHCSSSAAALLQLPHRSLTEHGLQRVSGEKFRPFPLYQNSVSHLKIGLRKIYFNCLPLFVFLNMLLLLGEFKLLYFLSLPSSQNMIALSLSDISSADTSPNNLEKIH